MKKTVTWILVADHQLARFFYNDGPGHGIHPLDSLSEETHLRRGHDIVTDREGRGVSAHDGRRHGIEPTSDPHREEGAAFIRHLAGRVEKALADGAFERLILIAPPRALGELRQTLDEATKTKIIGELARDLTKSTTSEIFNHVGAFIAT